MKYKSRITSFHYLKFENIVGRQAGVTLGIQIGSTLLRHDDAGNNTYNINVQFRNFVNSVIFLSQRTWGLHKHNKIIKFKYPLKTQFYNSFSLTLSNSYNLIIKSITMIIVHFVLYINNIMCAVNLSITYFSRLSRFVLLYQRWK